MDAGLHKHHGQRFKAEQHRQYQPHAAMPSSRVQQLLLSISMTADVQTLTLLLTLFLPLVALFYIRADYAAFLSLGPGGTPATPLGYVKLKFLSLVCLRNPHRPLPVPPHFRPQKGYLSPTSLQQRPGLRPLVQGIAPQRQQTQKSSGVVYEALAARMRALIAEPANCLVERTSCFERHSAGIFASTPITRTCGGEVCHAHPSDGSMHMTLHPADARIVLENEWGERHPLARGGWCRRFVPREFMLIYAPRNLQEIDQTVKILAASIWWVAGINVELSGDMRRDASSGVEDFVRKREEAGHACYSCGTSSCGAKRIGKMTDVI